MATANSVAKKLEAKYKTQWNNPLMDKEEAPAAEESKSEDPVLSSDKEPAEASEAEAQSQAQAAEEEPVDVSAATGPDGMPLYESFNAVNVVNEGSRFAHEEQKAAEDFDEALE